jgi:hypothetical protein
MADSGGFFGRLSSGLFREDGQVCVCTRLDDAAYTFVVHGIGFLDRAVCGLLDMSCTLHVLAEVV